MYFELKGPKATLEEVAELEQKYKVKLPMSYKMYLMQYGACYADPFYDAPYIYYVGETNVDQTDDCISRLYGCDSVKKYFRISEEMDMFGYELKEGQIYIGDTEMYCLLILDCTPENGGVWMYDHTGSFTSKEQPHRCKIADSFEDFLSMIDGIQVSEPYEPKNT